MYCRRRNDSVGRQGFTLVEILVVLVILGIASAMVIPRLTGMGDIQASSAARVLLADLQYAQNEAVVTQENVTVIFANDGNGYQLQKDGVVVTHPLTKGNFAVDYPQGRGMDRVRVESASFNGGRQVTFDSLGAPDNGGSVVLSADGNSYQVTVAAVTGKVTAVPLP